MHSLRCLSIRNRVLAAIALVLILAPVASSAQNRFGASFLRKPASVSSIDKEVNRLAADVKGLEMELESVKTQLADTQARVDAGVEPQSALRTLESDRKQGEIALAYTRDLLADARRLARLAQPVDVVLKSASIRQAAEALSRASGLGISVDGRVPKNIYVKTKAWAVPLGTVLEVIANATHLQIAPGDRGDLVLQVQGTLIVDGNTVAFQGDSAPWSDEWAMPSSGVSYPLGRRWLRLFASQTGSSPVAATSPAQRK